MADTAQNSMAGRASIAEDDPFAELTRIMGFDPREPVTGPQRVLQPMAMPQPAAGPQPTARPMPVEAPALDADFDIDLERELLGEFADDGPAHGTAAHGQAAHGREAAPDPYFEAPAYDDAGPQSSPAVDHETPPVDFSYIAPVHQAPSIEPDFDLSEEAYGDLEPAPAGPISAAVPQAASAPQAASVPASFDDDEPQAGQGPAAPVRADDRFEADVDLPQLRLGERRPAPVLPEEPSFRPSHEEALELTLESELDALLGNGSFEADEPAAVQHGEPAAAADGHDAGFAGRFDAMDPDSGYDAVDEYDDARAQEAGKAAPLAEMARRWSLHTGPRPDGEQITAFPPAAAPAGLPEEARARDFDDPAFDTAAPNGLNGEDAVRQVADALAGTTDDGMDAVMPRDGYDPYAALAALSADIKGTASWQDAEPEPAHSEAFVSGNDAVPRGAATLAPDIDTIDVPEQAVALADDLDLPDFAFEDEPVAASSYDDIDAEFASLLNEMNGVDADAPGRHGETAARAPIDLDRPAAVAGAGAAAFATAAAFEAGMRADDGRRYAADADFYGEAAPAAGDPARDQSLPEMDFGYDPDAEEDIAPAYQSFAPEPPRRRGLLVAGLVAGVAVLGGVGALALSFGGGSSGEVALVKADPSPTKVRPQNPGGTAIPNQDNKVYDSVAGVGTVPEPAQKALVESAEAPLDLPLGDDDEMADAAMQPEDGLAPGVTLDETGGAKAEDRVEQAAAEPGVDSSVEVAAVPPRKVRTMIVKADGTLVAREDPEPATTATTADTASESMIDPAPMASDPLDVTGANPAPAAPVAPAKAAQKTGATPAAAPIAPARPSDQPLDIVGEVSSQQVAALAPAAAGSWAVQIASQPTEAAAQASFKDLSRRYASVLGGRQASIVKADIAGKGTYWRVRVAAASRAEAVKLCETYKAAGGSCFVSK
jgi:hypothetical protein